MNDIHTTLLALQVLFLVATGLLSFQLGAILVRIYKAIKRTKVTCKYTTSQ